VPGSIASIVNRYSSVYAIVNSFEIVQPRMDREPFENLNQFPLRHLDIRVAFLLVWLPHMGLSQTRNPPEIKTL
jgi:hypothetical protein